MNEPKQYITFKTFEFQQIRPIPLHSDPNIDSYSLSMLRSMLLLKGIYQIVPNSLGFHEFALRTIETRKVSALGSLTKLVNQILDYYFFDRRILWLSHGLPSANAYEYWLDTLQDSFSTPPTVFLKTSSAAGSPEVLQLARLDAVPGNIRDIYNLLRKLRLPETNLQALADSISSNQNLVASLTSFIQKSLFKPQEKMGLQEVFLLLGQENLKDWVLSEVVQHSQDLISPQAEQFHYPAFNRSLLPGIDALNGSGFIEAIYILGFLCLSDDIHDEPKQIPGGIASSVPDHTRPIPAE